MSRKDLNQARAVLEAWARYQLDCNGFPEASPLAKIGEMRSNADGSRLPDGVEPNGLAQDAIFVFAAMRNDPSNKLSLKHRSILQKFYVERKDGETVSGFCKRVDAFDHNAYSNAVNEFAHKLDMYYLLQDIVHMEQTMCRR